MRKALILAALLPMLLLVACGNSSGGGGGGGYISQLRQGHATAVITRVAASNWNIAEV